MRSILITFTNVPDGVWLHVDCGEGRAQGVLLLSNRDVWRCFFHYALEEGASLKNGLFGRLADGAEFDFVAQSADGEMGQLAIVVSWYLDQISAGKTTGRPLQNLRNHMAALGVPVPAWLTMRLLDGALGRFLKLLKKWPKDTQKSLELKFGIP